MRFRSRNLNRIRLRYHGAVLRVYTMDVPEGETGTFLGYWTHEDVLPGQTPWRAAAWLVLGRPPRDVLPDGRPDIGVREPKRPIRPMLSGAVELPLPDSR